MEELQLPIPAVGPDEAGDEVVGGVGQQLRGLVVLLQHSAGREDRDLVAELDGLVDVMGDEHDRLVQFALKSQHLRLQFFADHRVHCAERLVHQQNRRVGGQRARHPHPLLLTAGQLRRVVLHAVGHPDLLECLLNALLPVRGGHPAIGERKLHVLVDGQVADEVEGLEDEADLAVPDAGPVRRREVGHRPAVEHVLAVRGRIQEAEDGEQRRLAASRGPGNRDVFSLQNVEMHVGQGVGLHLVGVEDLLDALELNQGAAVACHAVSVVEGSGVRGYTRVP